MKKHLILCLLLLSLLPLLFACNVGGGDEGDADDDTEGNYVTGKISYCHPDDNKWTWVDATFLDGELQWIELDVKKITFKNRHLAFAGLFTEREGGVMIVDAEGNVVPGAERPAGSALYVQGKGHSVSVETIYLSGTEVPAGVPRSVHYGDAFADTLPVPFLEGRKFLGWYEDFEGFITGPDGVVYDQYRKLSSHHSINVRLEFYTSEIKERYIRIYPKFEEGENSYYDVTFAFNDGTYRESVAKVLPGTAYADIEMPSGSRELGEIVGWSVDPHEYIKPIGNVIGDVTLYAVWKNYRYSCIVAGLGEERVEKVYEGESFELGTPKLREGYTFIGWYDNELYLGSPISGTVTYEGAREYYYARWEENEGGKR